MQTNAKPFTNVCLQISSLNLASQLSDFRWKAQLLKSQSSGTTLFQVHVRIDHTIDVHIGQRNWVLVADWISEQFLESWKVMGVGKGHQWAVYQRGHLQWRSNRILLAEGDSNFRFH